jgi:PAS domain S-box-containing protein
MPKKLICEKLEKRIQELEQTESKYILNERALQEGLDKYRSIINNIPLLICSFLPGGEISLVNSAYCDYFDKTLDELVGSNFLSLIPDVDQKTVMDNISALTVEVPTQSHEHSVIAPNGDIRWQHWTNRAIFDARGTVVGYQSIGEDITERKRAKEALRESEELHRITLSNISDAVFITDDAGVFTFICPNVSLIFGYSYEEVRNLGNIEKLLGINLFDLNKLRSSREIKNIECVIQDKSGVAHILLVNVKLVSIKGGTVLYTCRDITDRKRTEEALLESEERYTQLFNNESDAVMVFDATSKQIEDANPATLDLFGYSKKEFVNLTVEDISAEKDKTKAAVKRIIRGDSGGKYIPLSYFIKKDGIIFPGEIYAGTFISNGRKKIIGAVRDIANRMRAEEAIRELSFRLWTAQEMERKRIASELHDDLGQTLAFLKIQIKNIQNKLLKHQDELKKECENSLKYADQLIEKVRTLSHGLTPISLTHLGLTASLQSLIEDFSKYSYMNITKDIANIDRMFPPIAEITIYRIFQEIFTNLEKHAHADYVKIEVIKQDSGVFFKIEDNGKGFDLERIELNYLNERRLGLASMKERVRMLGGRFKIQSQLDEGTKINFTIPFEKAVIMSRGFFSFYL